MISQRNQIIFRAGYALVVRILSFTLFSTNQHHNKHILTGRYHCIAQLRVHPIVHSIVQGNSSCKGLFYFNVSMIQIS